MAGIRITFEDLDGAVANLDVVARQLAASDESSEAAAAAVGHDGLARRVREAADSWDDNRERFQESAAALAETIEGIAAAFRELDLRLAGDG